MKGNCSDEMLNQLCADVAADAVLSEMRKDFEAGKRKVKGDESSSDDESFYSTCEVTTARVSDVCCFYVGDG